MLMDHTRPFVFCALLGLQAASLAASTPFLSKSNISPLYNKTWQPISEVRESFVMNSRFITISDRCPTPYTILNVTHVNGSDYLVEIREEESGVQFAPMVGLPGCFSDGMPFIVLRVSSASPGSLLQFWHCTSSASLKQLVVQLSKSGQKDLDIYPQLLDTCHSEMWEMDDPS